MFTGVTNNDHSYCVTGALLQDEICSSFEWFFESFIHIFVTAPQTILTDNDLPYSILTDKHSTKHGLYIWHMLKNIKSNMTSKLGLKYSEFYTDLVKLGPNIPQRLFLVNNDYAEMRSYLDALNKWHERWAPAYLKDYFFADMSSTQRKKSMNKLLKGFLDSKSMLTEFLTTFERTLDAHEEAKQISAYKELVYSTCSILQNSIKNQAANCLT
ncbi:946_t:CDS:2, partial [Diversispora eburnea]